VSLGVKRLDGKIQVAFAFGANAGAWTVEQLVLLFIVRIMVVTFIYA